MNEVTKFGRFPINEHLLKIKGIAKVEIDQGEEKISLMGNKYELSEVLASLNSMGYPQKGDNTLFKQVFTKIWTHSYFKS